MIQDREILLSEDGIAVLDERYTDELLPESVLDGDYRGGFHGFCQHCGFFADGGGRRLFLDGLWGLAVGIRFWPARLRREGCITKPVPLRSRHTLKGSRSMVHRKDGP